MAYTGHSFRCTAITVTCDSGLTDESIMFMSDHKCEESLKSYCRRQSTIQKHTVSSALDNVATGTSSSSAALVPVAPFTLTAVSHILNYLTDTETEQSVFTERTPLRSFDMPNQNVLVNSQTDCQNHNMFGFVTNSVLNICSFNFNLHVTLLSW